MMDFRSCNKPFGIQAPILDDDGKRLTDDVFGGVIIDTQEFVQHMIDAA